MKPTIIYVQEQPSDTTKITITKQDLESAINDAYEQGKQDAIQQLTKPVLTTPSPSVQRDVLPYINTIPTTSLDSDSAKISSKETNVGVVTALE